MTARDAGLIIWEACLQAIADRVPRLGAALAFYMTFSIAPLLLVVVMMSSVVYGRHAAEGQLLSEIEPLVGEDAAAALQALISVASRQRSGTMASVIAGIIGLMGAIGFFCELQDALNGVFVAPSRSHASWWWMVRSQLLSFLLVFGSGLLLLISLTITTTLSAMTAAHSSTLAKAAMIHVIPMTLSFCVITVLFALVYRILPDITIAWRDAWFGALTSSGLFVAGKSLLGFYLGQVAIASVYGAAGSIVVLMLWNYYSAQIFLLGAEMIKVRARRR